MPGIRTHRATFSNGAENEIFTERRIIKAEACERADRWLLANNPRCRLIRQRFLPDQVLAIQGTHAPIDGLAGRTLIGCAKSNAVANVAYVRYKRCRLQNGLIRSRAGRDKRTRIVSLTKKA